MKEPIMKEPIMKEPFDSGRVKNDAQFAAALAGVAVVIGFVIYWSSEIQAVREMLALAYG